MVGVSFSKEEIDAYTVIAMKAKKNGKAIPKTFIFNNKKCQKFKFHQYDVDLTTKRLYQGICLDENSIDVGQPRLTLAENSLTDRNLAQEYLFRQFRHQPKKLRELQKHNLGSKSGKEQFMKIFCGLLHARFDIAPAKFIEEGANGAWNLGRFCLHAQAYVELFKDHTDATSTDEASILQTQRHMDFLSIIIGHCDDESDDRTNHDLEAIKEEMKSLKQKHDKDLAPVRDGIYEIGGVVNAQADVIMEIQENVSSPQLQMKQSSPGERPRQQQAEADEVDGVVAAGNCWKNPVTEADTHLMSRNHNAMDDDIVAQGVTGENFRTLFPGEWLCDPIVNGFVRLLQLRDARLHGDHNCYFFYSFFFNKLMDNRNEASPDKYMYEKVKNWTQESNTDIFAYKKAFVPIHNNLNRWLLAVIDFEEKKIQLYHSFRKKIRPDYESLNALWRYLKDEHQDKKGHPLSEPEQLQWNLVDLQLGETPYQTNDDDGGVFVCMFAYFLSLGQSLEFTQDDITNHGRNFVGLSLLRDEID